MLLVAAALPCLWAHSAARCSVVCSIRVLHAFVWRDTTLAPSSLPLPNPCSPPSPLQLTALPDSIGGCSSLLRLGLKGNRLVALPASIGQLASLVELYLTGA